MAHPHIHVVSRVLRHAVGVLLICWLRALRWGTIAGLGGLVGTEIIAIALTRHFPPSGLVHLIAIVLATALAAGTAVTVIADELLMGIVEAIRMLLGEAEAGTRAAAVAAEREVGEASAGLIRLVGLGRLLEKRPASAPAPRPVVATSPLVVPAPPRVAEQPVVASPARVAEQPVVAPSARVAEQAEQPVASPPPRVVAQPVVAPPPPAVAQPVVTTVEVSDAEEVDELVDEREDTAAELAALEASGALGPRTRVTGAPVRADLLPRISWTDEHEAVDPALLASAVPRPPSEPVATPPTSPLEVQMGTPAAATRPLSPDAALDASAGAGLAEPAEWHVDAAAAAAPAVWHDPMAHAELEPEDEVSGIQPVDLFGGPPPSPVTRPLPETTRPLGPSGASDASHSSMWDHISQVLAGRPVEPLPAPEGDASDANADAAEPGEGTPPAV